MNHSPNKISANGLEFAYVEVGRGPLVLCLHGFPDNLHTYDRVLPWLAESGYHAVAVATRGIYPSSIPQDENYSPIQLGRDALALIKAFGEDRAVLLGHDWGAMAAYAAANLNAASVAKMITMAIPHPRAVRMDLRLMSRGWHFGFLAVPLIAERAARIRDFALLEHFWRAWSPDFQLDSDRMDSIRATYSSPGTLAAALGYYRAFALVFLGMGRQQRRDRQVLFDRTSTPTLCIAGTRDGVFEQAVFDRTPEAFLGFYELVKISGVGHFPHLECTKKVVDRVLDFLRKS